MSRDGWPKRRIDWKRVVHLSIAAVWMLFIFVAWTLLGWVIWWALGGKDPDASAWFEWYCLAYFALTCGLGVLYDRTKP